MVPRATTLAHGLRIGAVITRAMKGAQIGLLATMIIPPGGTMEVANTIRVSVAQIPGLVIILSSPGMMMARVSTLKVVNFAMGVKSRTEMSMGMVFVTTMKF